MSRTRLTADGLWQCLCPSFNASALSQSCRFSTRLARIRPQCIAARAPVRPRCQSSTSIHGHEASRTHRRNYASENNASVQLAALSNSDTSSKLSVNASQIKSSSRNRANKPSTFSKNSADAKRLPAGHAKFGKYSREDRLQLAQEPTSILYELLRSAASHGNTQEVDVIVTHLVHDRHEAPNLRLYGALMLVNVNVTEGSVSRVNALFQEMEDEGIALDVGICHDILKVLAIHPDYLVRARILEYMRQRWINITGNGQHDVAAGAIRDGQLEWAGERMAEMRKEGVKIQDWLYDMQVYALLECGEVTEAFNIMRDRLRDGDMNISKNVWHTLLDTASSSFHHAATLYAWNSQVIPGYLNPSSGTCFNVLSTAARAGDVVLATEVFRTLGQRSTVFTIFHYEDLLIAYLNTDPPDLRAALSVMTIMAGANLEPTNISTRCLFVHLQRNPEQVPEALEILTTLHGQGRAIPLAAVNVLVEAHVDQGNFDEALALYKSMHTLAPPEKLDEPFRPFASVETINHLLRGARNIGPTGYDMAMFLASEQLALRIKPDNLTYDRLITVCLVSGRSDNAWRYFDEADNLGLTPRASTANVLAKHLAAVGDERCWEILQRVQEHGQHNHHKLEVEAAWRKWQEDQWKESEHAEQAEEGLATKQEVGV